MIVPRAVLFQGNRLSQRGGSRFCGTMRRLVNGMFGGRSRRVCQIREADEGTPEYGWLPYSGVPSFACANSAHPTSPCPLWFPIPRRTRLKERLSFLRQDAQIGKRYVRWRHENAFAEVAVVAGYSLRVLCAPCVFPNAWRTWKSALRAYYRWRRHEIAAEIVGCVKLATGE